MPEKKIRNIALMTSGGDAPGMNPCIRAVVRAGLAHDLTVFGIEEGYEGLIHGKLKALGARDVGSILQRGGTILQTARSQEFRTPHGQREAIRQLNNAQIDGLVVIGGDGSLNGAVALNEQGIQVVGIPASIDNDIYGTDMCIGVDTALNTVVDAIDKLRDTASSHNRAFLVEIMGRQCGYLALRAGIICGAELVLIPEIETPLEEISKVVDDAYLRGKTHCIIVVAEGFKPHTAELAQKLEALDLGFDTRVTILGHIQRGGKPSAFDRMLASRFGVKAVEFLVKGQTGVMTGLKGADIVPVELTTVVNCQRSMPEEYYQIARMLVR